MDAAQALVRLGGLATTSELLGSVDRRELDRAVAAGELARLGRGRYTLPGVADARTAAAAVAGTVSHLSAALHWGWKVRRPPTQPAVTVPRSRKLAVERRAGLDLHWADLPPTDVEAGVTTRERTVLDCARALPFDESLSVADSALRSDEVARSDLLSAARDLPRTGRSRAVRVLEAADGRAANPFESVLRSIALDVPGLRVLPQVYVERIGRADLVDVQRKIVLEAESYEFHGDREAFDRDVHRYTAMQRHGWLVARFLWIEVMQQPAYVRDVLVDLVALRYPPSTSARS